MFPKRQVIWNSNLELEESLEELDRLVKASRVFALRITAFELGPKIYISRKWPSFFNPFAQSIYTEIVGEFGDRAIKFEVRESMIPSLFQVLIGLILIFIGIQFATSGEWIGIAVLPLVYVLVNAFLYFQIKNEVFYQERKLKELLAID